MNGKVVQKATNTQGATLHLVADDTPANRDESKHITVGSDVWLNSGEQGKLISPDSTLPADYLKSVNQPLAFPRYVAAVPPGSDGKPYLPRGSKWTTERDRAVLWLYELGRNAAPSPLLTGSVSWSRVYRPLLDRLSKAGGQKDVAEMWRITQEIRDIRTKAGPESLKESAKTFAKDVAGEVKKDAQEGVRTVAKGVGAIAETAGETVLAPLWESIPLPYKLIGGGILGAVVLRAILPSGKGSEG